MRYAIASRKQKGRIYRLPTEALHAGRLELSKLGQVVGRLLGNPLFLRLRHGCPSCAERLARDAFQEQEIMSIILLPLLDNGGGGNGSLLFEESEVSRFEIGSSVGPLFENELRP